MVRRIFSRAMEGYGPYQISKLLSEAKVEIYFNFVGRYIPPALQPVLLTPEEQEELRKKEECKDRLHQIYLRRKANGKQKEWEERYNAKRKAKMEAAGVTEELKARDPMRWVGLMNSLKAQAEEAVITEIIME
ncbi:MAG: TnpV protein [Peptoniphilaceae bacterium]|nr:TnpV protein [Peptoniphilaceae bacterium]